MSKRTVIGDVFNEMSSDYDSVMDRMVPHYRKLIMSIFEYLPETFKPGRIADLGCGNGNPAILASTVYPKASMHLVDASEQMLTLCRKRLAIDAYEYSHEMFQDLSLQPNSYDLVYACFSLHHLDGPEKQLFFREIFKALKSGGIFASADLFINKEEEFHKTHLKQWREFFESNGLSPDDWVWVMEHYNAYDKPSSFNDQQRWLLEAGFSRVRLSWNVGQWGCFHAFKE